MRAQDLAQRVLECLPGMPETLDFSVSIREPNTEKGSDEITLGGDLQRAIP